MEIFQEGGRKEVGGGREIKTKIKFVIILIKEIQGQR